jgi:hypothetical protein
MKLFHVFLSIYILVLSSLSCTDVDDISSKKITTEISTGQSSNPHEDETCSPFCICACCGSMAVHFSEKNPANTVAIVFNKYFLSQENEVIDISSPVWQPPKIA